MSFWQFGQVMRLPPAGAIRRSLHSQQYTKQYGEKFPPRQAAPKQTVMNAGEWSRTVVSGFTATEIATRLSERVRTAYNDSRFCTQTVIPARGRAYDSCAAALRDAVPGCSATCPQARARE